ncbi:hypothetical protein CROQUDRAFT_18367, partial [Cronartium quercuum f. sp. fusiforme G11]
FFHAKNVTLESDKVHIVRNFLQETNVLAFYTNGFDQLIKGSWEDFDKQFLQLALLANWVDQLHEKITQLRMTSLEDF